MMSVNNRTIIITSPSTSTKALPAFPVGASPTTGRPVQYRIEERKRTVYVTSDVAPSEWDADSLDTIFTLAEGAQSEHTEDNDDDPPIRRARSLVDTQITIVEDDSPNAGHDSSRDVNLSPRSSPNRLRRPANKSPGLQMTKSSGAIPTGNSPRRSPIETRRKILFYHKTDPYYGFTNFSDHPVMYKGKRYPTSEHLFQSFKFHGHRPNLAEHIRTCSERPSVAFSEARRFQPEVRPDWKQLNVPMMEEALWHKFTQHADLQAELLGTGDAELIEDSDKDAFWGVGVDRRGRNELGKALERLRTKLREC
ncbi:hypothetical protein D9611_001974 [Ephemerocybe angulata]|uniref:NADAR domain-containing protein n=1 Tax=Ephemerocybe angulata TaxID=980116 RepID=A0A8H5CJL3_9AGAR|nr:hypothetical protein D9611_001974 [Tulosesus angulatus]